MACLVEDQAYRIEMAFGIHPYHLGADALLDTMWFRSIVSCDAVRWCRCHRLKGLEKVGRCVPSQQVREMVNDEEKRLARQMIPNYLIVDGNVDG